MLILKTFRQLEKYPSVPPLAPEATLQAILSVEKQQKDKIRKAEVASQFTFDSLNAAYDVSKKFRKQTYGYIRGKYALSLHWVYRRHSDTLKAHGLYFEKLKETTREINEITRSLDFNANYKDALNDLLLTLFPQSLIWSFDGVVGFKYVFDNILQQANNNKFERSVV
ncbi:MAG: hypothetical protein JWQ96_1430 [Segetibacter sp.]|nr:hypothetical protein [Segetibacter sp.]